MATLAASIGESMISTFLRPVIEKAAEEARAQCYVIVNINKEMSNLLNILGVIESALPEAEVKKAEYTTVSKWLRDLEDICYEGRDILDEFFTVSAIIKAKRASKRVKFNSLRSLLLPLRLRCRLAKNIRRLRKKLNSMKNDMETKNLLRFAIVGDSGSAPVVSDHRPKTGPSLDKQRDLFVGREVQKESIMDKLLNYKDNKNKKNNENRVRVVSIWGMGGVGKTTFARSVYNDEKVTEQMYPNKKWLCVGETKFNAKEIINKITNDSDANDDVETYQKKLKEKFKRGRFLIVLDDIWIIDSNEWELFWNPLTEIEEGGIIIITTREKYVLNAIGTPVSVNLQPLRDEDSWKIFETHAFNNDNSVSDDYLDEKKSIGKEIVQKLNGHPLALKVVGSSLLNEHKVKTWRNFLQNQKWMPSQNENGIKSALRWSYNFLPPRLKKCFTYCSLFPKNHVFNEKILVQMWMALGFIDPNLRRGVGGREEERPEDIGEEYFKQLVNASLFQCVDGVYKMHDMIHELAMLVSNDEIVGSIGLLSSEKIGKTRHVSIFTDSNYWENLQMCNTTNRLLTLHSLPDSRENFPEPITCQNIINDLFKQMKSLRVLVLISKNITSIPDSISELIHLRYLDIIDTRVQSIPNSLCDLYNLQKFTAPRCSTVPKNIVNMANLRYLTASLSTCKGIKNLSSLQELYSISICKDDNISELGYLKQLRGKLRIEDLENATSSQDSTQGIMQHMTYLDDLVLKFKIDLENIDHSVQAEVLDALQCPPNIKDLFIDGYKGHRSPSWMSNGMHITAKLKKLSLHNCYQLVELPPLGQLKSLESLSLYKMDAITRLGDEFYGKRMDGKVFFPALKSLGLATMEKLKEWKSILIDDDSMMFFPCLTELIIRNCPELVEFPPLGQLNSLENLVLSKMDAITRLGDEFYGKRMDGKVFFPALKTLFLGKMTKLKEWKGILIDDDSMMFFPCLTRLNIYYCPELMELPPLGQLNSLESLVLEGMRAITILGDEFYGKGMDGKVFFPVLKSLGLATMEKLKEWKSILIDDDSMMFFPCLTELIIENCPELVELPPLGQLNSLENLVLSGMCAITRLGDEFFGKGMDGKVFFPALKTLALITMEKLKEWKSIVIDDDSMMFFPCLTDLTIRGCPELVNVLPPIAINTSTNFSNVMGKSLSKLTLKECDGLVVLEDCINKLSSLKELSLENCTKLQALPDDCLPPLLENLTIRGCPLLVARCEEEFGTERKKIKHFREKDIFKGSGEEI